MFSPPGLRETAESLIQAEMAKAGSSSSSGDHPRLPSGLEHDLFANAPSLQSLLASYPDEPLAALDTSRYQLPPPAEGVEGDVEAWKKASDNARAQLEHLNVRWVRPLVLFIESQLGICFCCCCCCCCWVDDAGMCLGGGRGEVLDGRGGRDASGRVPCRQRRDLPLF